MHLFSLFCHIKITSWQQHLQGLLKLEWMHAILRLLWGTSADVQALTGPWLKERFKEQLTSSYFKHNHLTSWNYNTAETSDWWPFFTLILGSWRVVMMVDVSGVHVTFWQTKSLGKPDPLNTRVSNFATAMIHLARKVLKWDRTHLTTFLLNFGNFGLSWGPTSRTNCTHS